MNFAWGIRRGKQHTTGNPKQHHHTTQRMKNTNQDTCKMHTRKKSTHGGAFKILKIFISCRKKLLCTFYYLEMLLEKRHGVRRKTCSAAFCLATASCTWSCSRSSWNHGWSFMLEMIVRRPPPHSEPNEPDHFRLVPTIGNVWMEKKAATCSLKRVASAPDSWSTFRSVSSFWSRKAWVCFCSRSISCRE